MLVIAASYDTLARRAEASAKVDESGEIGSIE
jgi:hypothetical protein